MQPSYSIAFALGGMGAALFAHWILAKAASIHDSATSPPSLPFVALVQQAAYSVTIAICSLSISFVVFIPEGLEASEGTPNDDDFEECDDCISDME